MGGIPTGFGNSGRGIERLLLSCGRHRGFLAIVMSLIFEISRAKSTLDEIGLRSHLSQGIWKVTTVLLSFKTLVIFNTFEEQGRLTYSRCASIDNFVEQSGDFEQI